MSLSNDNGGAAGELIANIGPLRFKTTKKRYEGPYRVTLSDPVKYWTLGGEELEPVYSPPLRSEENDPNNILIEPRRG